MFISLIEHWNCKQCVCICNQTMNLSKIFVSSTKHRIQIMCISNEMLNLNNVFVSATKHSHCYSLFVSATKHPHRNSASVRATQNIVPDDAKHQRTHWEIRAHALLVTIPLHFIRRYPTVDVSNTDYSLWQRTLGWMTDEA